MFLFQPSPLIFGGYVVLNICLCISYCNANLSQSQFIAEALYFLATSTAKISILMFYLRIFTGRKFKIIVWSLIFVCIQYGISTAAAIVFGCRPISSSWDLNVKIDTCIDRVSLYYANSGLGIFIDLSTFVLPL